MTGRDIVPTTSVLLNGHFDTYSNTGRPARLGLLVACSVRDLSTAPPPVFAKLDRGGAGVLEYRALGDRILVPRFQSWQTAADDEQRRMVYGLRKLPVFQTYEVQPPEAPPRAFGQAIGNCHALTGDWRFDSNLGSIDVDHDGALDDRRGLRSKYDTSGLEGAAADLREAAFKSIVVLDGQFHVSWHLPRWQITRSRETGGWKMNLDDAFPNNEALSYRADRNEIATAKLRQLDPEGRIAGGVVEWHPEHAPVLPDDIEHLAKHAVPPLTWRHDLMPRIVDGRLIGEWHDGYNGAGIVAREGNSGAVRVLGAGLLLMDFLRLRDLPVPEDLYARILYEGVPHPEAAPLLRGVAP